MDVDGGKKALSCEDEASETNYRHGQRGIDNFEEN